MQIESFGQNPFEKTIYKLNNGEKSLCVVLFLSFNFNFISDRLIMHLFICNSSNKNCISIDIKYNMTELFFFLLIVHRNICC